MKNIIKKIIIGFLVLLGTVFIILILITFFQPPSLIEEHIPAGKAELHFLTSVLSTYYMDIGRYPSTAEGLKALIAKPAGVDRSKWDGPYLNDTKVPIDLWRREIQYRCPGIHNLQKFDLWTDGADGKPGGTGKDKDIGNW